MKLFLLLFLVSSAVAVNAPNGNRAAHPYEIVRTGNRRVNDVGSKAPLLQSQFNRLKPVGPNAGDKSSLKKSNGVPPYAVLMEPLVKYSQPDPLYNDGKESLSKNKTVDVKSSSAKIKRNDQKQISSKSGHFSHYEDNEGSATLIRPHRRPPPHPHHVEFPGIVYLPQEPEPIIEIIVKESNQSLPAPPPPPPPPKKKKEQVQVFYVKYKKEPSPLYGEEKIIYDSPVPAVTPPTNNADSHDNEEEEEEYQNHQPQYEDVTLPPRPSTTLKAIIRPDSETYHGKGIRVTFGQPIPEEGGGLGGGFGGGGFGGGGFGGGANGYLPPPHNNPFLSHHNNAYLPPHNRGDYEEQSAPEPSVILPPKRKAEKVVPRANSASQLTKRNPAPFQPATQSPQQSFNSGPTTTSPRDFHRPTPPPAFQQTPQFPAQQFKHQPLKTQPTNPPVLPTPYRPNPTTRYSTLPQHLQSLPKPQQSFSFPPPRSHPPQQQVPQATVQGQQYYSISQPHLKSSFQVNSRPTSPPQYHTISNQAAQQHNFPKSQSFPQSHPPQPSFHQAPKPFPQPSQTFPQPSNTFSQQSSSFPASSNTFHQSNTFSQVPQQFIGPIIQTQQVPHNTFGNRPALSSNSQQIQQQHQQQIQQQHQQQIQQQHQQQIQQLHHHQQIQQHHHQQQQQQQNQLQQQVEQLNRLQQQQQRLQSQILNQQKYQTTSAPEIIRSVSPQLPFTTHRFEAKKPQTIPTPRPQFSQPVKSSNQYTGFKNAATTTPSHKKYPQTTQTPIEYVTLDPKKAEEERRKKEEKKKQNIAALPDEVPADLRAQLLSSGILGNADIQILDYDKIGDIPLESLPPEALANFQAVAGSEPVPAVVRPDSPPQDAVAEASEQSSVVVQPHGPAGELMEMKVVRYNPDSGEGARVADQYVKEGATQLEPVVLNDSKYNRYLPLKVAGAQFPVPDVPELRGKNVTSVVVLAPVDYEFLQRHEDTIEEEGRAGRRSSHPVLEVQGVHFVAGDVLKTLVKTPTSENYKKWLERENKTSIDKQSVVLLVIEPKHNSTSQEKEIYMYDIGTQKVSKLSGELSAQFVEVAESNSANEDLEEISDSQRGDFTIKDTSEISPTNVRVQRKIPENAARRNKSTASPR